MSSSAGEAGLQISPGISTIREAQKYLAKYFAPTRLVAAPYLSAAAGKNVYLKLEAELPTSSFKVRGAFWALAQRMSRESVREVVASSTGNHGAAVAYAAKQFGIKAKIFLPTNCNPVKRGRIAGLGAAIVESGGGDLASASGYRTRRQGRNRIGPSLSNCLRILALTGPSRSISVTVRFAPPVLSFWLTACCSGVSGPR